MDAQSRGSVLAVAFALTFALTLGAVGAGGASGAEVDLPNPTFEGAGGAIVGTITAPDGVPDSWRAFAVGGGAAELEVLPAVPDEIFEGSPATNFACFRVTAFGADQGFDDDNGRFPLVPGVEYHAEFWVRTGNLDGSDQAFRMGFPIFRGGAYLGREPGRLLDAVATSEWQQVVAPVFFDAEVDEGHISWRCDDDGGENAICIALPSIIQDSEATVPPTGLTCVRTGADVDLSWANNGVYDSLRVERDGTVLASLPGDATSYRDEGIEEGVHTYAVVAVAFDIDQGPECEVRYVQVEPGTGVSVDLGDIDIEDGLANTQRQDGTDGENEFVICGPEDDLREARSNWASADPTFEAPDGFFYLNVTDPDIKSQETLLVTATVYDDPLLAGVGLYVQYTNRQSTGPGDIENTFYPQAGAPVRTLEGSGEWVDLSWPIEDAGFRSFQQGTSDFRIGVTADARVCMDRVEVVYLPLISDLTCRKTDEGVDLSWTSGTTYDEIRIVRDGTVQDEIEGDATSWLDSDVPEGDHTYAVVAVAGAAEVSSECQVTVYFVAEGTRVSVDLGEVDEEDGLASTVRADGSDGENEFVECGPADDLREARANLGTLDGDAPDTHFYFEVTDLPMKAQEDLTLRAVVYDDPALAGVGLYVQYTHRDSTGPADIPNTFFPLEGAETHTLEGTDAWVQLEWSIVEAGFRTYMQGAADFRIAVTTGDPVCIDEVVLQYGEDAPTDPVFHRGDADGSGEINVTDAIFKLGFLFLGGPEPQCLDAADANDDGQLNITGGIYILNWLFLGGPVPPAPGPTSEPCGPDPTEDPLTNADCVYEHCGE